MKYQRGLSLNAMIIGSVILAIVAIFGAKITPDWIEFGKIKKAIRATAGDPSLKESTVTQVRAAYQKRAEIDDITSITPQDIDITKEGNELVLSFAYEKKVHLFKNVSVVFDFEGNSNQE
jgi:hypothetical protein